MKEVVIVDYDSGNLHSAEKAIALLCDELGGRKAFVSNDPDVVARADSIILPGDGAYGACRRGLSAISGMEEALKEAALKRAIPFLGICVGMQMLGHDSDEFEMTSGFGWVDGSVRKINSIEKRKVPHMGWNSLEFSQDHPALGTEHQGKDVYFVHSFAMQMNSVDHLVAQCEYGQSITAIVGRDNILGFQFHPEKSQDVGLSLLRKFLSWNP